MNHLAFVHANVAAKILNGTKVIESRLSVNCPPAWKVQVGDSIYFKVTGGNVVAQAIVIGVDKLESLRPVDIPTLAELYSPAMGTSPLNPYWQLKVRSRYAVMIHLGNVQPCYIPASKVPKGIQSGWVTNFQVGEESTNPQLLLLPFFPTV